MGIIIFILIICLIYLSLIIHHRINFSLEMLINTLQYIENLKNLHNK